MIQCFFKLRKMFKNKTVSLGFQNFNNEKDDDRSITYFLSFLSPFWPRFCFLAKSQSLGELLQVRFDFLAFLSLRRDSLSVPLALVEYKFCELAVE